MLVIVIALFVFSMSAAVIISNAQKASVVTVAPVRTNVVARSAECRKDSHIIW